MIQGGPDIRERLADLIDEILADVGEPEPEIGWCNVCSCKHYQIEASPMALSQFLLLQPSSPNCRALRLFRMAEN
jgi:hypothetical protein